MIPAEGPAGAGYLGLDGSWRIQPRFREVGPFSGGRAWARQKELYGIIDLTGDWVVRPKFANIGGVGHGYMRVTLSPHLDRFGLVDRSGKQVLPFDYLYIGDFHDGFAFLRASDWTGYVTLSGRVVRPDVGKSFCPIAPLPAPVSSADDKVFYEVIELR